MTAYQRFTGWIEQIFGAGASALPAPGSGTLGGIFSGSASAGQCVTGVDGTGTLQYGAAGSPLQRGVGSLKGYDVVPSPSAPATLYATFDGSTDPATLYLQGYEWTAQVVISDSDPGGVVWVQSGQDVDTTGYAIAAGLTALNLTETISWNYLGAGMIDGVESAIGTTVQVLGSSGGGWTVTGGGAGSDGTGSGQVTMVTLIPGVAGKQTKLVNCGGFSLAAPSYDPSSVSVAIGLWDGSAFHPCTTSAAFNGSGADTLGAGPYYDKWTTYTGLEGLDLVAQFGSGTVPTGGEHVLWVIADQP